MHLLEERHRIYLEDLKNNNRFFCLSGLLLVVNLNTLKILVTYNSVMKDREFHSLMKCTTECRLRSSEYRSVTSVSMLGCIHGKGLTGACPGRGQQRQYDKGQAVATDILQILLLLTSIRVLKIRHKYDHNAIEENSSEI